MPPDIVEQKDLVYREVGGRELALDLYRMKGQPEPALAWSLFTVAVGATGSGQIISSTSSISRNRAM